MHSAYPLSVIGMNVKGLSRNKILMADATFTLKREKSTCKGEKYSLFPSLLNRYQVQENPREFSSSVLLVFPVLRYSNRMLNLSLVGISILLTYDCHQLRTSLAEVPYAFKRDVRESISCISLSAQSLHVKIK